MHKIDSSNAGPDNEWIPGDPLTGVLPTSATAAWFNAVQDEIVNYIVSRGISPEKTDNHQLKAAINEHINNSVGNIVSVEEKLRWNKLAETSVFSNSVRGTNWEDIHRNLYLLSSASGSVIDIFSESANSNSKLVYSGDTHVIDDKEYHHVEIFRGEIVPGETARTTASRGMNAKVSLQLTGIDVPFADRRGLPYAENLTAAGVVYKRSGIGTIKTAEILSGGGLFGSSGNDYYYRADIVLAESVEMHLEFDDTGVHLFLRRSDNDYNASIGVYSTSLTVTS